MIKSIDINKNNELLITPIMSNDRPVIYNPLDNSYTNIEVPSNNIASICWNTDESVYYSTVSPNNIYRYSPENRASYLIYGTSNGLGIINVRCVGDQVMAAVQTKSVQEGQDDLIHVVLENSPLDGTRIESILPMRYSFGGDTYFIGVNRHTIIVKLEYDSLGDGPSPAEVITNEINGILQEQGVDTTKYQYILP